MSTRFLVYESHLSYILQFLSDFGLYGCGILELDDALERCATVREEEEETCSSSGSSEPGIKFAPSSYFRESRLPLEVDVVPPQILNRHRLSPRNIHHKLQIPAPHQSAEQLVLSVRELWEDERKHRQELGLHPSPEIPVDLSESSRGKGGEWVAEARWWEEIARRIERERELRAQQTNGEQKPQNWERFVMTTFESIEAIWEDKYRTWKPAKRQKEELDETEKNGKAFLDSGYSSEEKGNAVEGEIPVDVDISMLSDRYMSQLDQEDQAQDEHDLNVHEQPREEDPETDIEEDEPYEEEPGEGQIVREDR
jgi:DNA polymerase zeta